MSIRIDLFSDVMTKPTPAMRRAMADAEVGDEQKKEDPTTNRLQAMTAELLGKEAALFLPSGSMCNQVAIRVLCRPGDEIIVHRSAHIVNFEVGGAAALSGVSSYVLDGPGGMFTAGEAAAAIRPLTSNHHCRTRAVCVEQTSNIGGGRVWPLAALREIGALCRAHGLAMHMDGARLMNAVVASGVSAEEMCRDTDSVWLDLSKGLGCPVGAVLAGSKDFIKDAWRWKHQFGGALRQSGIIAAAGVYALENNVARLAEDHANARLLADGLKDLPGVIVEEPETNIVFFDVEGLGCTAQEFAAAAAEEGLRVSFGGKHRIRAITYLGIDESMVREAVTILRRLIGDWASRRMADKKAG